VANWPRADEWTSVGHLAADKNGKEPKGACVGMRNNFPTFPNLSCCKNQKKRKPYPRVSRMSWTAVGTGG